MLGRPASVRLALAPPGRPMPAGASGDDVFPGITPVPKGGELVSPLMEYLIVGGGGQAGSSLGGSSGQGCGGAGGGGGVMAGVFLEDAFVIGTAYPVSIGEGGYPEAQADAHLVYPAGAGGWGGGSSLFNGINAWGSGGGGGVSGGGGPGGAGGSGGGGGSTFFAGYAGAGGAGGYGGSIGYSGAAGQFYYGGGGGGGGGPASGYYGGPGYTSSISGAPVTYAKGGSAYGEYGLNVQPPPRVYGTGDGGVAAAANQLGVVIGGGYGGSGIVILRYRGGVRATGGEIAQIDGWTIHTFDEYEDNGTALNNFTFI